MGDIAVAASILYIQSVLIISNHHHYYYYLVSACQAISSYAVLCF